MNIIEKYAGLEYITLTCKGDRVSFNTALEIEKKISEIIIRKMPIRGIELSYLRKQLNLSCAKLSLAINGALSSSAIAKLEKKGNIRLSPVNEVFFRTFFAKKLNIEMTLSSADLVPDNGPSLVEIPA